MAAFYQPGLVWYCALVHLIEVGSHPNSQPSSQFPTVHCIYHTENLSPGEAQAMALIWLVVKVGADVEGITQVGLQDLLIN